MCGIVAIVTPDSGFSESILLAMRDRLIHRGPDGEGLWVDRSETGIAGLGHRRLSIIDLSSAAAQPMLSVDKRYALTFNGEIYNYIELREELRNAGHIFHTTSDSEVLLTAYAAWGESCLTRLNGMFAFMIWDRVQKHLFVARDRFGEKPLYFSRLPGKGIVLASEIKALFAHPAIIPEPDQAVVDDFLAGTTSYVSSRTFFKNIERLPPAYAMLIDVEGNIARQWRYWNPDYETIRNFKNTGAAIEELSALLVNSVRMRMRADVKVGTCLSGGLDSSTISGIIAHLQKRGEAQSIPSFSARFDNDPTISEGYYIDQVNRFTRLKGQSVTPHPQGLIDDFERLHWHQEQPFLSASMYLEWCITKKAKETGTTVLLDGQGADEIMAGYQYYFPHHQYDQLIKKQWPHLFLNTVLFRHRLTKEAKKYADSHRRISFDIHSLQDLHDFHSNKTALSFPARPLLPEAMPANTLRYTLAKEMIYDTLANNLHSGDSNGMAHSVETRFPYLDHRLVDFCMALPSSMLIKFGWQKYILRKAARNFIPANIRWRPDKLGFAAPQDVWLRGDLKNWAVQRLFEGPITRQPAYDRNLIQEKWNLHQSGVKDVSWELWRWISMNEWLMLFESGAWKNGLDAPLTGRRHG